MNKLDQFNSQYKFDKSYKLANEILKKDPTNKQALITLGNIYSSICQHDKAIKYYKKAENKELALSTLYYKESDLSEIKQKTIEFVNEHKVKNTFIEKPFNKELKIGYVGTNFHNPNHPVSRFIFNILRFHSLDVTIYQIGNKFNLPIKINNKTLNGSNYEIANEIYDDNIDILIELMNHTSDRIFILKYRPARIQISYCAFPGTTGMNEIDYKIMDKVSSEGIENYFTEKVITLPFGFHTYCPTNYSVKSNKHSGINFCCFNNPLKITKEVIKDWIEILNRVPNSRLYLQYHYYQSYFIVERIKELFGNVKNRVFFIGLKNIHNDVLELYNTIDIALDTYPYNGTTITCEALFMNVPVFTRKGNLPQSRIGASLLSSIQCNECIVSHSYIEKVIEYCDKDKLKVLKEKIKNNLTKNILGNPKMFMKGYEEQLQNILKMKYDS